MFMLQTVFRGPSLPKGREGPDRGVQVQGETCIGPLGGTYDGGTELPPTGMNEASLLISSYTNCGLC